MYFDAKNFIDQISEISPRLTENLCLTLNLAFLVDLTLADCYRSAVGGVAESEQADDAFGHALKFTRALDERNFDRRLVVEVSNAFHWYVGYYYRCNRWENSKYVGDAYRKRVLRLGALAQSDGGSEKKVAKIYDECWNRWAVEPDELDWDVNHCETSPRCVRRR